MFIYNNISKAVLAALIKVYGDKIQSEDATEAMLLENPKWGARDRHTATHMLYSIIRFAVQYRFIADTGEDNAEAALKKLMAVYALQYDYTFAPDFTEPFDKLVYDERVERVQSKRSLRIAVSEWLDELGYAALGEAWETEMQALNTEAKVCLRVNNIKTNREYVKFQLDELKYEYTIPEDAPDAVVLAKRYNLKKHRLYKEGLVEVQDVSSQRVAYAMDLLPGMRVLDACAGAGGKTLHIAALMHNSGHIAACDVKAKKLKTLHERSHRAGAEIIYTHAMKGAFVEKHLEAFDRVLLDVPCSSLGSLRHKPDLKHTLTQEKLTEITATQAEILDSYSTMVKPGCKMIYSTCSILPQENTQQIHSFIERHSNFSLLSETNISPAQTGFDGFYIAVLEKKI